MAMLLPECTMKSVPQDVVVYVAGFGNQGAEVGLSALEDLRVSRVSAVSDFRSTTLKAHLRQADRLGCRFTLILGDDEVVKGTAVLRDMVSKTQHDILLSSLPHQIKPFLECS
jgi:histidyl-tRNA synthetase